MRQLLKRTATPGQSHIADLYERYAPELLLYIRRHISSQEDAEDALLETFIAALENPHLNDRSQQEQLAWLRRVAHNKFVDFHRRRIRHLSISIDDVQQQLYDEDDHAPEILALGNEEHTLLHTRLASLPKIQQEVLRLRFAEGLRCPEIAKRLDKSDGAIRTMLSRILNLLRNIYANSEEEAI